VSRVYHGVETTRGTFVVGHRGTSQDNWLQWAVSELFSLSKAARECDNQLSCSILNDIRLSTSV